MRAPRLVAVLAATAALSAGLAACSDSGDDTTAQPPVVAADDVKTGPPSGWSDGGFTPDPASLRCGQTAADPTRGITDTEITIGGLAYLTSPNGSSMAGVELGAKARFDRANDEGGVNGRKINYIGTLDDGNDPARNGSQAKVLVEQKKVFAAVPLLTSSSNYLDTFCADTVPFFGWGTNPGYCGTTIGFGITGCQVPSDKVGAVSTTYGLMIQAMFGGDAKGKTTALVGVDNDSARTGTHELARQISAVGIDVVYEENPIPVSGLTDTTAVVNAIMTSNKGAPPDVVLYIADFNSVVKLTGAMTAAGFQGKHLNPVGYDPRLAASSFQGLQQSYTIVQWQPGVDTSVPAVKQLADDLAKYTPEASLSLTTMSGYWAADMFITAATKAGPDLTVDSLLKLLNSGTYTNYVEGALPETRFPVNHVIGAPCASIVQLNGNKYDITSDLACGTLVKK
ncbi:ABC transporter substrate-binding protein [Frankia sp. CNm7]|uniref:ABC transporter substrate-binding protein n=1 Tax=Frankia nepalensis TaxID=1836974 RepID=A0A937RRF8_9ACTN|nr:ABC transporter substrate-binding protein [Frankia nepalensis]MBL7495001.1 ABC transporter substrate-binding protein [Frankia nepalensis]MBL7514688.1 ABC transporter substrate-binding protein [Frankia nepalensis]MBL7519266.1 ABC transporter substrate-binding protein [Frankia nepalensis]MBL7631989.1 ABC transporter substrate-binding protein [Frankia nepalensis]